MRHDREQRTRTGAHRTSGMRANRALRLERLEQRQLLAAFDILVFSRTTGFRHSSIDEGIAAIESLAAANDFSVTATENPNVFAPASLDEFEAIVFLNTTGNILNAGQEAALQQFIQAGGGFVGVHAAADTEHTWPWYGELVGAYFQSHPAIQSATVKFADRVHPSTAGFPDRWTRTDEWYNYNINPRSNVHVLATLDESTYSGGTLGFDHPISWCHEFEGGRSWYTGMGHTEATYSDSQFRAHLLGGIEYAAGAVPGDCGASLEENFTREVLDDETDNPMELEVLPDGRVLYIERAGDVHMYSPATGDTTLVATIPTTTLFENGLLGIAADPDFATNQWLYLFYSDPVQSRQNLSRFTFNGTSLESEVLLLEVPHQRQQCCHSAGSLAFGPDGNLFISTGDDTSPFASNGYTPIDERPGRSAFDAQKSSSNTDDLRGKILRVTPQDDGTISIPEGNLFPADGSAGRPEIYVMGNRNPFRISVDSETGWLYWGDVGPDAGGSNPNRGPRGHDEINQARGAGNFGWPYFVGDNQAYVDFDFQTGVSGATFDPDAPSNDSPNNTGAVNLPPAEPAWIWYPGGVSQEFPELGTGGRTAMAGPVIHFDVGLDSQSKLPGYYDDTLLIYEWSRSWIKEVKLDAQGGVLKINDFMPGLDLRRPMDMEIGPDGAIYLLEWGTSFGGNNSDSRLSKIVYTSATPVSSADFDQDGDVDGDDFLTWQNGFGQFPDGGARPHQGDANGDGQVDGEDFLIWQSDFGRGGDPGAAAIAWGVAHDAGSRVVASRSGLPEGQPGGETMRPHEGRPGQARDAALADWTGRFERLARDDDPISIPSRFTAARAAWEDGRFGSIASSLAALDLANEDLA